MAVSYTISPYSLPPLLDTNMDHEKAIHEARDSLVASVYEARDRRIDVVQTKLAISLNHDEMVASDPTVVTKQQLLNEAEKIEGDRKNAFDSLMKAPISRRRDMPPPVHLDMSQVGEHCWEYFFVCPSHFSWRQNLALRREGSFSALASLPPPRVLDFDLSLLTPSYLDPPRMFVEMVMRATTCECENPAAVSSKIEVVDSLFDVAVLRFDPQVDILASIIVKQTGPSTSFDASDYQRMSKHLASLRNDVGVSAPIGILTTYNEWQFCWHEYASAVAEATTLDQVRAFSPSGPVDFETLVVSPVYSCQAPELLTLLASFVYKVNCIPRCDPLKTCWAFYTPTIVEFQRRGLDPSVVDPRRMVPADVTQLYKVAFLRSGCDGCVYKMATEDGACCAVKFIKNFGEMAVTLAEEECAAWKRAYGEDCGVRTATLAGQAVLIMPLYEKLTSADWEKPETVPLVIRHVKELLKKDVMHMAVHRLNVMWEDPGKTSVRLINWAGSPLFDKPHQGVKDYLQSAENMLNYEDDFY